MPEMQTESKIMVDSADVVALAKELIATPSVNPQLESGGTGEERVAELVAGWLRQWGFEVECSDLEPGRPNVVARLERGRGPTLALNGHLDTVGVAGMTIDPFDPVVRDDRLWGRGSADMKGGVAAILAAARDAVHHDFTGTLVVVLTADEEEAGRGARQLLQNGLSADGVVICEPTGLDIMPAHRGFTWVELTFRGRATHGSQPQHGVDAIRHAGQFLARLGELEAELANQAPHPLLGHGSLHAGTIQGGTAPPVYPDKCSLTLEKRTLPAEGRETFRAEVEAILDRMRSETESLDVSVEVLLHGNGAEVRADHPLIHSLQTAAENAGQNPAVVGMPAWVEAASFADAGVPAICFGPGQLAAAHAADEAVPVNELYAAQRTLRNLIGSYLQ